MIEKKQREGEGERYYIGIEKGRLLYDVCEPSSLCSHNTQYVYPYMMVSSLSDDKTVSYILIR